MPFAAGGPSDLIYKIEKNYLPKKYKVNFTAEYILGDGGAVVKKNIYLYIDIIDVFYFVLL
jgi:tripartite-type tricarboxylate transporter receptor subunit TctC